MNDWRDKVHALAVEKGWYDDARTRNIPEALALIHSEVSEALEEYRDRGPSNIDKVFYNADNPTKPVGFAVELVDVVIRCLDLAGHLGIDVDDVIRRKHEYNTMRPYRHGKVC